MTVWAVTNSTAAAAMKSNDRDSIVTAKISKCAGRDALDYSSEAAARRYGGRALSEAGARSAKLSRLRSSVAGQMLTTRILSRMMIQEQVLRENGMEARMEIQESVVRRADREGG
jgi:hypothetical protein